MRTVSSLLALFVALTALVSAGCSKSETTNEGPDTSKAAAKTELPPLPEPEAKAKPAAPGAKATTETSGDALGTLPEGVGLEPGSSLPNVALTDIAGDKVELESLVDKGPALIIFYRGGWCPYCNFQVKKMTDAYAQFRERGVTPVLISVDSPDEAAKTSATYEIPFPVLSDSDLVAHKAFNVAFEVDAETLAKYKGYGIDLEKASGKDHHHLAVPSVFLVDANKKVLWAHADEDYTTRPSTAQLLESIDGVLAK